VPDLSQQLAKALQDRAIFRDLAGVPALLIHPDWQTKRPLMIWIHGRTAHKELDSGRYLRWLRAEHPSGDPALAGFATCALDLPMHGQRFQEGGHDPRNTLVILSQMLRELDLVLDALESDPHLPSVFDLTQLGLGGMSAGGMVSLRRACQPHPFVCLAVEGSAGNLSLLYGVPAFDGAPASLRTPPPGLAIHAPESVHPLDPMRHLDGFRPVPLLALHSEADQIVPLACMTTFLEALGPRYQQAATQSPATRLPAPFIQLRTWPRTGAPQEHSGFGTVASEAKSIQTDFLSRVLFASPQ
jgi:dienelactone hydrolase